ncbi:uroporphyrinogen-III synthase [Campylobacter mucosalis]|uniref:uroporphyrinogen-III synthase n=1 Tax=Campylobacter mucosalis TaxID=202 RepID=UPI0014703F5A|nr:uroporphyrinogen-III synthase [Campylobacter mucosalis]
MIYLVSNTPSSDESVKNLNLSQIKFYDFSVDLANFNAIVITSKNAIKALEQNSIVPKDVEIFAVGKSSAVQAEKFGFKKINVSSSSYGDALYDEFKDVLKDRKILYLRAKDIVGDLDIKLAKCSQNFTQIVAYESIEVTQNLTDLEDNSVFIFTSPKNAKFFLKNYTWRDSFKAVAIGQSTAEALKFISGVRVAKVQSIDECIRLAKTLL